jgi:NAD(P)-dependent dehydrogenase (short-subunit alcohol dehydrogenase family)
VLDLSGRVALVTGAGQGVGAGIADALAQQGATVWVNDLFEDRARAVADDVGSKPVVFDVTDLAAVRAGVATVGRVDVLVNNAGIPVEGFPQVDFKDSDPDLWRRFVDLDIYGVMNCTHATISGMCERRWGRVITIGSEAGRVGSSIRVSLYGTAKAGAMCLMKHLAHEVGPMGVTCNALSLGPMEGIPADPSQNPVPRWGRARDVAAMTAFLASDEAEWITGQVIPVNGGLIT